MDTERIPEINIIKAIIAAAGGSITLSGEVYEEYLSMDLDEMRLDFSEIGDEVIMRLKYKGYEEADHV